jgi:hypothetical protein
LLSVILTPVPVAVFDRFSPQSVATSSPSARTLWHRTNRSPSPVCPTGAQPGVDRQKFAEQRQIAAIVAALSLIGRASLPQWKQSCNAAGFFRFVNGQPPDFPAKCAERRFAGQVLEFGA